VTPPPILRTTDLTSGDASLAFNDLIADGRIRQRNPTCPFRAHTSACRHRGWALLRWSDMQGVSEFVTSLLPMTTDDSDYEREPLRIIAVNPPHIDDLSDANGEGYRVTLNLSRPATHTEIKEFEKLGTRMRIYGSTLEIYRTSMEYIEERKNDLVSYVAEAEKHALEVERRRAEQEAIAAKRARRIEQESQRLTEIAQGIHFG
jgi:hypothetical protein